jgi:hypothetical protein
MHVADLHFFVYLIMPSLSVVSYSLLLYINITSHIYEVQKKKKECSPQKLRSNTLHVLPKPSLDMTAWCVMFQYGELVTSGGLYAYMRH